MELVKCSPNRPVTVIDRDGWRVFVSVHDAAYLRKREEFKSRLLVVHPDRGGSATAFRQVCAAYQRWKTDELEWYAGFDLMPPRPGVALSALMRKPRGRPRTTSKVILQLLMRGEVSVAGMADHLGVKYNTITIAIHRLRRRGLRIWSVRSPQGEWVYRLEQAAA